MFFIRLPSLSLLCNEVRSTALDSSSYNRIAEKLEQMMSLRPFKEDGLGQKLVDDKVREES